MTFGAAFLVFVDDFARAAFGFEVPVGVKPPYWERPSSYIFCEQPRGWVGVILAGKDEIRVQGVICSTKKSWC
jgi:hypothetical protein